MNDFELDLLAEDRSPNTVRTQVGAVRRFLAWAESGGVRAHEVSPEDVRYYRDRLRREGKKPATINGAIIAIRRFYELAGYDERENPAALIRLERQQDLGLLAIERRGRGVMEEMGRGPR